MVPPPCCTKPAHRQAASQCSSMPLRDWQVDIGEGGIKNIALLDLFSSPGLTCERGAAFNLRWETPNLGCIEFQEPHITRIQKYKRNPSSQTRKAEGSGEGHVGVKWNMSKGKEGGRKDQRE